MVLAYIALGSYLTIGVIFAAIIRQKWKNEGQKMQPEDYAVMALAVVAWPFFIWDLART